MKRFWNFKAASGQSNPQLMVYGEISEWWGVDSKSFTEELNAIDDDEIDVRINSIGGSVFTAQAIYSSLRRHKAKVNVFIDGMAASAATIIAAAGDTVYMPENAMMMIHNPASYSFGSADDLRTEADVLDKVRDTLVAVYRNKTGLNDEKIIELLDNETYMTAEEAKELGFVDIIEEAIKVTATMRNGVVNFNGIDIDEGKYSSISKHIVTNSRKDTDSDDNKEPAKDLPENNEEFNSEPENKGKKMDLDQIKNEYPDLYEQLINQGAEAERERIAAIDELGIAGHEDLVAAAKNDKNMTAEKLAVQIIKAEKEKAKDLLNDRTADASDINSVQPSNQISERDEMKAKEDAIVNNIAEGMRQKRKER